MNLPTCFYLWKRWYEITREQSMGNCIPALFIFYRHIKH